MPSAYLNYNVYLQRLFSQNDFSLQLVRNLISVGADGLVSSVLTCSTSRVPILTLEPLPIHPPLCLSHFTSCHYTVLSKERQNAKNKYIKNNNKINTYK